MGWPKGKARGPRKNKNVVPIRKQVELHFLCDVAIHEQIIKEANAEGRSVSAHIAWLMRCLYDPPAMTSCSRVHDMAVRKIERRS